MILSSSDDWVYPYIQPKQSAQFGNPLSYGEQEVVEFRNALTSPVSRMLAHCIRLDMAMNVENDHRSAFSGSLETIEAYGSSRGKSECRSRLGRMRSLPHHRTGMACRIEIIRSKPTDLEDCSDREGAITPLFSHLWDTEI